MKKILVVLVLCLGVLGCKSKTDKVMDGLENKLDKLVQHNKLNLVLFCTDMKDLNNNEAYKNENLEKCTTTVLKNEVDSKVSFRQKHAEFIKNHSVEDSIDYLYDDYNDIELETFMSNFHEVERLIDISSWTQSKDDIWTLKKANLLILWKESLKEPLSYSVDSQEIKNNNSVEWQRKKIEEKYPGLFD